MSSGMHTGDSVIRYTLNQPDKQIRPGMMSGRGGRNPHGDSYDFTNYYMTRNGKPHIPVVGEFHFARFAHLQWEEELLKMKSGGVNIVATYVFWNFHEEEEGVFDWGNHLNLRHFVDLCGKHELALIVRIGPFCHGEVRNGGMPDWLFSYPFEVRSNDSGYLHYAARLYRQIARQLKGQYFQEGGPIIGVQLENEYMHAGAPLDAWGYKAGKYITSGRDGQEHLAKLREIAMDAGIRPLFFTATAWGGAAVPEGGVLPMLAGYAYTPWIPDQPPSREYLFRDLHESPMEQVQYDSREYPAAYCELAGGMQVSYHARPYVDASSVEAMTVVKLANGSNLIGFYMYHGGTNPASQKGYLNEHALPKMTYDYQAPLGEFGRVGESYDRIRMLSMFLEAYGETLAPMGCVIPEGQQTLTPDDTTGLRWSMRQHGGSGFVFLNNYQDHVQMPDRQVRLELDTPRGIVNYPYEGSLQLKSGCAAILPFHFDLYGIRLVSATVQPLTRFVSEENDEVTVVFYEHEGMKAEYVFEASSINSLEMEKGSFQEQDRMVVIYPEPGKDSDVKVTTADGRIIRMFTLTREEALQTYRFRLGGQERLIIGKGHLYVKHDQLICTSPGSAETELAIYPIPDQVAASAFAELSCGKQGQFGLYKLKVPVHTPELQIEYPKEHTAILHMNTTWPEQIEDVFIEVDYEGDVAQAYLHRRMLTDHIQYGDTWKIGLKEFVMELDEHPLRLIITPIRKGTVTSFVNQAYVEQFDGIELGEFRRIAAVPHYRVGLTLNG